MTVPNKLETLFKVWHILISRRGETGLSKRPSSGFQKRFTVKLNCFIDSKDKQKTQLYMML
jgi:hypothetical protein